MFLDFCRNFLFYLNNFPLNRKIFSLTEKNLLKIRNVFSKVEFFKFKKGFSHSIELPEEKQI